MNFLGVGPMELIIVAVLAYLLLGPKKMGEAGKSVGRILRELRQQREEFTSMLMESVDLEDEPERPSAPSAPVGAVPQSGDPGDSGESDDEADGTATRAAEDGDGQARATGSDRGSEREEDK